jgi:hypothetical protein
MAQRVCLFHKIWWNFPVLNFNKRCETVYGKQKILFMALYEQASTHILVGKLEITDKAQLRSIMSDLKNVCPVVRH